MRCFVGRFFFCAMRRACVKGLEFSYGLGALSAQRGQAIFSPRNGALPLRRGRGLRRNTEVRKPLFTFSTIVAIAGATAAYSLTASAVDLLADIEMDAVTASGSLSITTQAQASGTQVAIATDSQNVVLEQAAGTPLIYSYGDGYTIISGNIQGYGDGYAIIYSYGNGYMISLLGTDVDATATATTIVTALRGGSISTDIPVTVEVVKPGVAVATSSVTLSSR